jgi:uncharacterized protein (TIGR02265 family)
VATPAESRGTTGVPFAEPNWDAPLDADAAIARIPETATISGMFPSALAIEARRRGFALPSARAKYVAFSFYPLREHARLLVETSHRFYPKMPLRLALRRLGMHAPKAMAGSTLGRVMFGTVSGVQEMITAMAKAYPINTRPAQVTVSATGPGYAIIKMQEIFHFLDCHHVGAFEGVLKHVGVDGRVLISARGYAAADLMVEWDPSLGG